MKTGKSRPDPNLFDGLDRLTAVTDGTTPVESFGYDNFSGEENWADQGTGQSPSPREGASHEAGNRTRYTLGTEATELWNYNPDSHELADINTTDVVFTHDEAGNLTHRTDAGGAWEYVYNGMNRLVEVIKDSTTIAEYSYDPFGRRIKKIDHATGDTTWYVYSVFGLAGDNFPGEENWADQGSGQSPSPREGASQYVDVDTDGTPDEQKTYHYYPGSLWGTNPLYLKKTGAADEYFWYVNDHLGTPRRLVDETGHEVWSAGYDAFGAATVGTLSVENNLRFPGQYYDDETGLHYNYHRYYDPSTGRYLRVDPIKDGLNWYVYASGNPIYNYDSLGLWSVWGGGSVVASWGPKGGNTGMGVAYDSELGSGGYSTKGTTKGAAAAAGGEIGFFTGSIAGDTKIHSIGIGPFSIGLVTDGKGDWGLVGGYSPVGAPVELTYSENETTFYPNSNPGQAVNCP